MSLPEQVQAWRTSRHLTIEDLADKCSLSTEVLSEIESGLLDPCASILVTIARGLGIPASWLYTDPRHLQLLTQYGVMEEEAHDAAAERPVVDPVLERILASARQDRTLFTLVTVLLEAEDARLLRAAEVSLRSLVKQVKPVNVPWVFRQPGNFEPPSD
ncbi:hypothetical protein YTPLAS18_20410 [Nitrospira sp.]|nr:hypothetical protein YTPLAS18_20410 [Nitrospira sp.]